MLHEIDKGDQFMNILVLGGTGYLGSRLINCLITNKHNIICLKRESSNLISLKNNSNLLFWSIKDFDKELGSKKIKIDIMINTACKYMTDEASEQEIIESNLNIPLSIFIKCLEYGIKKFITIGTGLPDEFNLYCFTKRSFANFGKWYSERENGTIKFCNIELENFYGINEPKNRFIPNVIYKLKNNEDILLTDGSQKRDFIYIDDVINAILRIIEIEDNLPAYIDLPLGTGIAPSIKEVIEYLAYITNSNSNLMFGAIKKRMNEPNSIADISIMKKYGIKVVYTWQEGLRKLI